MWKLPLLIILSSVASSKAIANGDESRIKYGNANQTLHRIINKESVEKLVLHSPRFNNSTKYGIVLLVISANYETALRKEIRDQWVAKKESNMLKSGKALVIFLVGRSRELDEEAATYEDLLQIDIEETYRNLIEAGFLWLKKHVKSEFVAKIDSDTVVHIDRLYSTLKRYERRQWAKNFLVCSSQWGAWPFRDEYSAWYVSRSDYPASRWPRFCSGPGYVMSRVAFEKIVGSMSKHHVLEVEDVFFTGIVAQNILDNVIDRGVVATQYTAYSHCDTHGPNLSILCTHDQFSDSHYKKNITAAWKRLKSPICYN